MHSDGNMLRGYAGTGGMHSGSTIVVRESIPIYILLYYYCVLAPMKYDRVVVKSNHSDGRNERRHLCIATVATDLLEIIIVCDNNTTEYNNIASAKIEIRWTGSLLVERAEIRLYADYIAKLITSCILR